MIAPEIAEQFAALDAMKSAAKDAGIPLDVIAIPVVRRAARWVCAKCKHPWRWHSFEGRQGLRPAVLRCVRSCGCKIELPSSRVDP